MGDTVARSKKGYSDAEGVDNLKEKNNLNDNDGDAFMTGRCFDEIGMRW